MNGTLADHGGDRKTEDQVCATNSISDSTNNDYWQARIQSDCPEELASIKSGDKRIIDVSKENAGELLTNLSSDSNFIRTSKILTFNSQLGKEYASKSIIKSAISGQSISESCEAVAR